MNDTPALLLKFYSQVKEKGEQAKALPNADPSKKRLMEEYNAGKVEYKRRRAALKADQGTTTFPSTLTQAITEREPSSLPETDAPTSNQTSEKPQGGADVQPINKELQVSPPSMTALHTEPPKVPEVPAGALEESGIIITTPCQAQAGPQLGSRREGSSVSDDILSHMHNAGIADIGNVVKDIQAVSGHLSAIEDTLRSISTATERITEASSSSLEQLADVSETLHAVSHTVQPIRSAQIENSAVHLQHASELSDNIGDLSNEVEAIGLTTTEIQSFQTENLTALSAQMGSLSESMEAVLQGVEELRRLQISGRHNSESSVTLGASPAAFAKEIITEAIGQLSALFELALNRDIPNPSSGQETQGSLNIREVFWVGMTVLQQLAVTKVPPQQASLSPPNALSSASISAVDPVISDGDTGKRKLDAVSEDPEACSGDNMEVETMAKPPSKRLRSSTRPTSKANS